MTDNKINFTKAQLDALPIPAKGKRSYYYDTKARGLGISITGAGSKTFIVYRWVNGKPERITLGRYPDLTIAQARNKTAEINATIAKGDNPNDRRRANMVAMQWSHINLARGEWRISETKNGTPQIITLSSEAITILENRKQQATNNYVFPSSSKSGHLEEPKRGWQRILKHAGLSDLRIHDLCRTLGSWQAKTSASLVIIGKSLNHKSPTATAIYARLDLDPVRESVEKATQAMLIAAGLKQDKTNAN